MAKKTPKQKYLEKRQKNLTQAELQECSDLEAEIISTVNKPKKKIYKGCTIPGSDKAKMKRLRKLRNKARGIQD